MFSEYKILLLSFFIQKLSADSIFVTLEEGVENQFDIVSKIQAGTFAVVFKCEWVEKGRKQVAIKIAWSETSDIEIETEVKFYKHLGVLGGDPNSKEYKQAIAAGILEVYASGIVNAIDKKVKKEEDQQKIIGRKVLIMEVVGLDLFEATTETGTETRVHLSNSRWLRIALEMLRAIQFLHSMKIIHGDIKLENFALRNGKSIGIFDFGSARMITDKFERIKGAPYFHSFLSTNRFIQEFEQLREGILPLLKDPGMVEDLESYVMSIYIIKIQADWYDYLQTFFFYIGINNLSTPVEEMNKCEFEAINMNQHQRDKVMKRALLKMLTAKENFPGQIEVKLGRVLQENWKNQHLEKIRDAIDLFTEIVWYARSWLLKSTPETMEEVVAEEDGFVKRCTMILESWEKINVVETSTLKSEIEVIKPVDSFVKA